jgi:hypothetical protein
MNNDSEGGRGPGDESTQGAESEGLERRLARLVETADAMCGDEEMRREPLVERAEARGLNRAAAERAYDLAMEERLPPAFGIAVTAAGVSVQPLESPRPEVGTTASGEPAWVDTPPPAREADVERRLRQTFRRVRSHLEESPRPRDAFAAFAREPDLERFDY